VPKIIISNTTQQIYFLELQSAFWKFQIITVSESCLIKLLQYIFFQKYSYILALEMASPANQHSANCIGTLSFPILISVMNHFRAVLLPRTFRQCTAQTSTSSQSTDGWIIIIIIIIIIAMTMFMVLSSWQSHCESSPGSFDECRLSAGWPPTLRPSQSTWAVSPSKIGSYHPHPPSPLLLLLSP